MSDGYIRRTVWTCAAGGVCIAGGGTLVFPFLSLYMIELGAAPEEAALWTSIASSATFLVGAVAVPLWAAVSDKTGRKKMILRAAGCLALAFLMGALVVTPLQFVGTRMFQGFSFGYFPICQSLISVIAGPHTASAMGLLMAGRSTGMVLGPFVGGVLSHLAGLRMSFFLAAAVDVVAFLLILFFVKEPRGAAMAKHPGIAESFRSLSHNRRFMKVLALMVLNQAAILAINPILALYVAQLTGSFDDADILSGIIFGCSGIAGVLSAPFWGRFCESRGTALAIGASFAGAGLFAALQYLAPSVFLFGALQFAFGLFIVGGTTSLSAAVAECVPENVRGSAYGLLATGMNVGNFTGPLLAGAAAHLAGLETVFILSGVLQLGGALWMWKEMRHHE